MTEVPVVAAPVVAPLVREPAPPLVAGWTAAAAAAVAVSPVEAPASPPPVVPMVPIPTLPPVAVEDLRPGAPWFYRDVFTGQVRGPYCMAQMMAWYHGGLLLPQLLVCRGRDAFRPLSTYSAQLA